MTVGHLTFEAGGMAFAVDAAAVQEVHRGAVAARLPFAPPHLAGLVHVGGRILPVVDLTGCFASGRRRARPARFLVALNAAAGAVAVLAERIGATLPAESVALAPAGVEDRGAPVRGRFEHGGTEYRLLDPDRIDLAGGATAPPPPPGGAFVGGAGRTVSTAAASTERYLIVEAGGHAVALEMDGLLLVFAPADLRPLPHAPASVRGVCAVHGRPLLLVDTLGAGPAARHAVAVQTPLGPVAVPVDAVRGVVRVPLGRRRVREATGDGPGGDVLEHDGRWLEVRRPGTMLNDRPDTIGPLVPQSAGGAIGGDPALLVTRVWTRFLTVRAADRLFALAFEQVRRVVEPDARERLPGGGGPFDGIAGVDGAILPVVELRRALGLPPAAEPGLAVVVETAGGGVALVVDEVQRLRKIAADDVDPLSDALTAAVIRMDGVLVPVLRPDGLLTVPSAVREVR